MPRSAQVPSLHPQLRRHSAFGGLLVNGRVQLFVPSSAIPPRLEMFRTRTAIRDRPIVTRSLPLSWTPLEDARHLFARQVYGEVLQGPPPNCLSNDIFDFDPSDKWCSIINVRNALRRGTSVDVKNDLGDTPLSQAAWQNHLEMVRFLLSFDADRTSVNNHGLTPLDIAMSLGADNEVLDLLWDPRLKLTHVRLVRCVKDLLDTVGRCEVTDQRAVQEERRLRVVLFCLDRGVSIDQRFDRDRDTILHLLCRNNVGPKTIDELLARGADINARNKVGLTALHLCARYQNSPDRLRQLLDWGANIEALADHDTTILHYAALNLEPAMLWAVLDLWRPRPVDVTRQIRGRVSLRNHELCLDFGTPLHLAASRGLQENVRALLAVGADIDAYAYFGYSALEIAFRESSTKDSYEADCVELLLERGADLNARGQPPHSKPLVFLTGPKCGSEPARRALVRQLALWQLGGQLSDEPDLSGDHDVTLHEYHESCLAELRKMQQVRLCPEATLFELLVLLQLPPKPGALKTLGRPRGTWRTRPIPWLEDSELIEALDRSCSHEDFPIYIRSLERSLATARERYQLHSRALDGLLSLFGHLPLVPAEMILGQLCPADQANLADLVLPPPDPSSTYVLETCRLEFSHLFGTKTPPPTPPPPSPPASASAASSA